MSTELRLTTAVQFNSESTLTYNNKFIFVGSCFSDHIANKMLEDGFSVAANPQGILYNPLSIGQCVSNLLTQRKWDATDLVRLSEFYISWQHHGAFKSLNAQSALDKMNDSVKKCSVQIGSKMVLILTWGTAKVYALQSDGCITGNCHKAPSSFFTNRTLTIDEIVSEYVSLIDQWLTLLPDMEIIFTVSPVRHIRDGLIENQRSKAILLLAIAELQAKFSQVSYFPAYEIMMDELRDYRFYDTDLIHPGKLAIEFIWRKLRENYFTSETLKIMESVEKFNLLAGHRLLHPESKESKNHLQKVNEQYNKLLTTYPFLKLNPPDKI
jgi:hypothetical protein